MFQEERLAKLFQGSAAGRIARERGIRMKLGTHRMLVGGLAMLLAAAGIQAGAQNQTQAQQSVPDAPQPQTLPRLNSITPVAPALPTTPSQAGASTSTTEEAPTITVVPDQEQDQGPPPVTERSQANTLSVNVQYHAIPFTVKDSKNRLVPGLTYRDVRVYENGVLQHTSVFLTDPAPLSVGLVIDQSVTTDTMEKVNDSLAALQGAFSPYDEIAVFTYNNGVKEQTTFTAAQSARLGAVLEQSKGVGRDPLMGLNGPLAHDQVINNMPIDGVADSGHQPGSMSFTVPKEYYTLNDAILAAAKEVARADYHRQRIIYVISDGKEYGSKATQKEVIRFLLTNHIEVWATQVGESAIKGMGFVDRVHIPLTMRDDALPKYTAATGGQFDSEFRPKGIEESFSHITAEVRGQYTVGYYTHESPYNESYRKTEIRVLRPSLTVIAPDGYYPNASDNARMRPKTAATTTPAPTPANETPQLRTHPETQPTTTPAPQ
jgi:VWFA-related protein